MEDATIGMPCHLVLIVFHFWRREWNICTVIRDSIHHSKEGNLVMEHRLKISMARLDLFQIKLSQFDLIYSSVMCITATAVTSVIYRVKNN